MFKRFTELRLSSGISVDELSKDLGITKEVIETIENGSSPSLQILALYAKYFHVTADYILELTDEKTGYSDTPS